MNNLAELWKERQKRKVKPYSKYSNARKYCVDRSKDKSKEINSKNPLTSMVKELISEDILRKLMEIR